MAGCWAVRMEECPSWWCMNGLVSPEWWFMAGELPVTTNHSFPGPCLDGLAGRLLGGDENNFKTFEVRWRALSGAELSGCEVRQGWVLGIGISLLSCSGDL